MGRKERKKQELSCSAPHCVREKKTLQNAETYNTGRCFSAPPPGLYLKYHVQTLGRAAAVTAEAPANVITAAYPFFAKLEVCRLSHYKLQFSGASNLAILKLLHPETCRQ